MEQSRHSPRTFSVLFPFQQKDILAALWSSLLFLFILLIHTGTVIAVTKLNPLIEEYAQHAGGMLSIWRPVQIWRNNTRVFYNDPIGPFCPDPMSVSHVSWSRECPAQLRATMLGTGQGKASAWVMYYDLFHLRFCSLMGIQVGLGTEISSEQGMW